MEALCNTHSIGTTRYVWNCNECGNKSCLYDAYRENIHPHTR